MEGSLASLVIEGQARAATVAAFPAFVAAMANADPTTAVRNGPNGVSGFRRHVSEGNRACTGR